MNIGSMVVACTGSRCDWKGKQYDTDRWHCPTCGREVKAQRVDIVSNDLSDALFRLHNGTSIDGETDRSFEMDQSELICVNGYWLTYTIPPNTRGDQVRKYMLVHFPGGSSKLLIDILLDTRNEVRMPKQLRKIV